MGKLIFKKTSKYKLVVIILVLKYIKLSKFLVILKKIKLSTVLIKLITIFKFYPSLMYLIYKNKTGKNYN